MAQAKGDEQSILRFVAEVRIYVQQYYGPLFTYGRKTRFDTRAALLLYLDQTIQFARLLDQLLPYIPYERMKRNPSSQQLKREVVLLALDLYTRATQQYIYISGQHIASGHVVADLAHYRSPDAQVCQASVKRLNAEYNNIPYVNDTLYQMDQEIAKLDAGAGEYNTLCARFWQEHPDLYAQYQDIPIFGRKKKQDAFKQEHFPPQLFEAEQRSLDQQLRAAQLRLKRKEFLEKNTR